MSTNLLFLLPAAICGLGGMVCANDAALHLRIGDNAQAVTNGGATVLCWAGAAVALWGALS